MGGGGGVKPLSCRHVGCLSERRIETASLVGAHGNWVCLMCFRSWNDKAGFNSHGRTKSHPLAWSIPEASLYCVSCGTFVNLEFLNSKQKILLETCIMAVKTLLSQSAIAPIVVESGDKDKINSLTNKEQHNSMVSLGGSLETKSDESYWRRRPLGLYNLGNTCFINAAVQGMAALDSFGGGGVEEGGPLTRAFFDLISTLRNSEADSFTFQLPIATRRQKKQKQSGQSSSGAINPQYFFDRLVEKYNFFEQNEQQDTHDFIRLLFNAFDDEHEVIDSNKASPAPHRKVFEGIMVSTIQCNRCKNLTSKRESCLDLSLAISPIKLNTNASNLENSFHTLSLYDDGDESSSLEGLLNAWIQPQYLNGKDAFACENCFRQVKSKDENLNMDNVNKVIYSPATVRCWLDVLPKCLIIHLQRFSVSKFVGRRKNRSSSCGSGYRKDSRNISLPLILSLPIMRGGPKTELLSTSLVVSYTLRAMVIHEGISADNGHYIAIVNRNGRWFRISDTLVVPISQEKALECKNAYLIFYERA